MTKISIIVAVDENNAIGFDNKLLFWLPNDLKRFKTLTTGHTIIMGRKTFESLPKGALPNRRNVVLSRTEQEFTGAEHYTTLEDALGSCCNEEEVFIIGGESIYKMAYNIATNLYITLVHNKAEKADSYFPEIDSDLWKIESREDHLIDDKHPYSYSFINYSKL